MADRQILHCDCNCFYASVEMQEHPELRGLPVAVCGDPETRHGIVLTASYPANGVKGGMAIWQTKQLCRDLLVVKSHVDECFRYSETNQIRTVPSLSQRSFCVCQCDGFRTILIVEMW